MIASKTATGSRSRKCFASRINLVILAAALGVSGGAARAANVLANPSMESGLSSWTCYGRTGQEGWYSYALASVPDPTVTGNNSFKTYAGWNGDPNFNGAYQDAACFPTSVFSATGQLRTKSGDKIAGTYGGGVEPDNGNMVWIEVKFLDLNTNILALYKSAVFDGAWDADVWYTMPVTNECDVTTTLPTNSVTTLVAPAGTVRVRYQIVLKQAAWAGGGAIFADDMMLNQLSGPTAPVIGSISPGAILMANPANGISFTASSASSTPINDADIHVTLNGTDISPNLLITGTTTNKNVSYHGLQTNEAYSVAIQVTDTLGLATTASVSFDTWSPLYLWEGEDYDFGGGQFIGSPVLSSTAQADSYFGVTGIEGVDFEESNAQGDHLYRASDSLGTTVSGDTARQKFLAAQVGDPTINDYKVGWFAGGEWVNYTRNYPAGTYNVYARFAGGAGAASATLGKVTDGWGTTEQTLTNLGSFSFTGTSWSSFQYVPLKDAQGNLVPLTLGGLNTLRLTTAGGGDINFLMLVPADTNRPVISAVYPDGLLLQQQTNTFRFSVDSPGGPISDGSIALELNGVNVTPNLAITGSANSKTVLYAGLLPNVPTNTAVISVTNGNGIAASTTVRFDTFSPGHYSWEGEDYNYGDGTVGGLYIDAPQTNAYYGLSGMAEVDYHETFANVPQIAYRTSDPMGTDETGDTPRLRYVGTNDYNLGWFTAGEWVNYTRQFPAGNYLVFGRFARGTGTNATPTLSRVTSGAGTTTQTTVDIGTFSVDSHGWGSYGWILLKDGSGNPVTLALDGSATTLRLTSTGPEENTEANANFFMLVPVASPVSLNASLIGSTMALSFSTGTGFSYQVQYKDDLTEETWKNLGTALTGNGAVQSVNDQATGTKRFYRVQIQ
jgi:hypothetical protein